MKGRCREVSTFSFTRKVGKAKKFFPSSPRRGEGRKIFSRLATSWGRQKNFFQARHVVGKAEKFFPGPPRRGEGILGLFFHPKRVFDGSADDLGILFSLLQNRENEFKVMFFGTDAAESA